MLIWPYSFVIKITKCIPPLTVLIACVIALRSKKQFQAKRWHINILINVKLSNQKQIVKLCLFRLPSCVSRLI